MAKIEDFSVFERSGRGMPLLELQRACPVLGLVSGWGRATAWPQGATVLSAFLGFKEVLGLGIQKLRLGMDFITRID